MAAFTAADVKTLRDRLGAGMLDSKNALVEAEGDIEKAIEILRVKGLKGVEKRSGRATTAGLVTAVAENGVATLIELASETDFVAKNDRFTSLAAEVLGAVAAAGATDVASGNAATLNCKTVEAYINDEAALLGEKVELRQVRQVTGEDFAIYLHRTSKDLPPQVGVVLGYSGTDAETARSVAQHIAVYDPKYATREDVPAETVEHERAVLTETTRNEGKPEAALPKIVEGKLTGFFKEVVLVDQPYARDSKVATGKVLKDAGLEVSGFARIKVGA
ncbi:translation elongation factor Ts [Amnibacterium kyonggiense]|uniref:Elongation factor Ts n=1 Tax=Amnibacterium kyonggiense TaxID=595671 RepID=A0A4R7FSW6_9MICO|nr:translation elongation factor Ts [Amnibacterium kyonggiense]TDS80971.1 translation elongation factor Ts (EF-Ts) [Amnibacterium kyonggiense]